MLSVNIRAILLKLWLLTLISDIVGVEAMEEEMFIGNVDTIFTRNSFPRFIISLS